MDFTSVEGEKAGIFVSACGYSCCVCDSSKEGASLWVETEALVVVCQGCVGRMFRDYAEHRRRLGLLTEGSCASRRPFVASATEDR